MSKTATLIRTLPRGTNSMVAAQAIYKFDPPLPTSYDEDESETTIYALVSASNAMFSGPEVYLFAYNDPEDTEPVSWMELPGSQKGTLSHEEVISDLGYTIVTK